MESYSIYPTLVTRFDFDTSLSYFLLRISGFPQGAIVHPWDISFHFIFNSQFPQKFVQLF